MYKFSENIRIRKCDQMSFLVNITNNKIFTLKDNTLSFLERKLDEGLIKCEVNKIGESFEQFINDLIKLEILKEIGR